MQVKDITITRNRSSVFKLFMLGDIHAGTIHCVEKDIKEKVREIKEIGRASCRERV